jgi:putative membrane protein (TIGR04086 family)
MIRSVLAIFAGIVVLTVASFAIEAIANPLTLRLVPDALSDTAPLSHSLPARLFMMAYTMFSIALGGYVTAWIARRAQVLHGVIMGAIEVALTLWAMFKLPHQAPIWSWITGMILTIPAAWFGAAICARHPLRRTRPQVS